MPGGGQVKDRLGQRYGRLTAIRFAGLHDWHGQHSAWWIARCDCGNEITVKKWGEVKSCGCSRTGWGRPRGETAKKYIYDGYRRNAKKRGYSWEIDEEDFAILTKDVCFYCGVEPSTVCSRNFFGEFIYNGVDRVDNTLGYILGNVVACCKTCSRSPGMPDKTVSALKAAQ